MKKMVIICSMILLSVIQARLGRAHEVSISLIDQAETAGPIGGIALSPDETTIYAAFWEDANSSRVIEYSLPDINPLQTFTFGGYHTHGDVVVSADGTRFFTPNYYYSSVSQIDMANGNTRTDLSTVDSWPWGINITPDKTKVLIGVGLDGRNYDMNNDSIAIYDIANGNFSLLASVKLNDEPVGQIGFSEDSLYAYVCTYPRKSSSPTLYEISLQSPYAITRAMVFPNYNERICGVACIGNNVYVSGSGNSTISVVDRSAWTNQEYAIESPVAFLAVHPNHQYIFAYLPQTNTIIVLDKNTMTEVGGYNGLRSSGGEFDKVMDIEFTKNGRIMYVSFRSIPGEILTFDINICGNDDIDCDGYIPPEDCNDSDASINPGATEVCEDGLDNDCDELTDVNDPDCQSCSTPVTLEPWELQGHFPPNTNGGWYLAANGNVLYTFENNINVLDGSLVSLYAKIDSNGILGPWERTTDRTTYRYGYYEVVTSATHIYIAGGILPSQVDTGIVEYAPINSDGSLGEWELTSSLNVPRDLFGFVISGEYLYALGGGEAGVGFGVGRVTEYAHINADGSLGPWQFGPELNVEHQGTAAAAINGYLYVLGGGVHDYLTTTVERAAINPDGSLGEWQIDTSLPGQRSTAGVAVRGQTIYLAGGYSDIYGGGWLTSVISSTVKPDHTLSPWMTNESLIQPDMHRSLVIANDHLFVGGVSAINEIEHSRFVDDCNGNGIADTCDIEHGTSHDCNNNSIPDECEGADICDADGDGYLAPEDCNDNDASINPSVPEVCDDGIDNDCDGEIDCSDSDCTAACDIDGDGVLNDIDNCPSTPNPQQENSDNDSYGDACDNCPYAANENQADSNGNGIGDACDLIFAGFFEPIGNDVVNMAKAGQAIPVKWRLTDGNGTPISDPSSFLGLYSFSASCGDFFGDATDVVEEYAAGASGLQYKGDGNWQYNWKTPKTYVGQCRNMYIIFVNGSSSPIAKFKFK